MNTRKIILGTMASVLAIGTLGGAYAASSNGQAGAKEQSEVAAVLAAPTSLSDAVRIAEKNADGKAFEAAMEDEDGRNLYEIAILSGDNVTEFAIDPATGNILESEEEGLLADLMRDDEELAALGKTKADLLSVIATAEQAAGGKAMEAEIDDESASPAFDVEVAQVDGTVVKVTIDGVTGKVLKQGPAVDDDDRENDKD